MIHPNVSGLPIKSCALSSMRARSMDKRRRLSGMSSSLPLTLQEFSEATRSEAAETPEPPRRLLLLEAISRSEAVFATGAVGSKGLDQSALSLRHEYRLSVGAAKRKIGRLFRAEPDLAFQHARVRQHRDGPLEDPRDEQATADVGSNPVDTEVVEFLHRLRRKQFGAVDPVRPDLAGVRIADIKRLPVRTEVEPVGRAHRPIGQHLLALDTAVRGLCDPPDLPVVALPVRVAGVDRAIGRDRHVVGLIEVIRMKIGLDRRPAAPDHEDIVLSIVGNEPASFPLEPYRI